MYVLVYVWVIRPLKEFKYTHTHTHTHTHTCMYGKSLASWHSPHFNASYTHKHTHIYQVTSIPTNTYMEIHTYTLTCSSVFISLSYIIFKSRLSISSTHTHKHTYKHVHSLASVCSSLFPASHSSHIHTHTDTHAHTHIQTRTLTCFSVFISLSCIMFKSRPSFSTRSSVLFAVLSCAFLA
jgi:hypothetical protein